MVKVRADQQSQLFFCYNGKYGGGRILLSSASVINDGKLDIQFATEVTNTPKLLETFARAMTNGTCYFEDRCALYKCKKCRIVNKKTWRNPMTGHEELVRQDLNIDGEDLYFDRYVKMENIKNSLEVIVDFKMLFEKYYPLSS